MRLAAMNLLARREHSRHELLEKLGRRFDPDQLEAVLDRLQSDGLLSDRRFAEAYVRHRAQRGFGPVRIRQELRQRGVAAADVMQAFDENDINWLNVIAEVVTKKYGSEPASEMNDKARRQRFLHYRGFSSEQIRDVLD